MQNTSEAYNLAIVSNKRTLAAKAILELVDGTLYNLGPGDIITGSLSVDSNCFDDGIELGATFAADCSLDLNNADGRWNNIDLDGATLLPYSGILLPDTTTEYVKLGTFVIDEPGRPYSQIMLKASDRMILLDEPFSAVTLTFPATNLQVLQAISTYCNVPLASSITSIMNASYSVTERPTDDITCRDAVGMIAMMAAGYARMNREGELEIVQFPALILNNNIDGNGTDTYTLDGICTDDLYEIGGADFTDVFGYQGSTIEMGVGSRYPGFKQTGDPVTVSGIQYNGEDETLIIGADNYLIVIEECSLLQTGIDAVIQSVYEVMGGFTYTGYAAEYPGNPAIDVGDAVRHVTMDGKEIVSLIASHSFVHGAKSKMEATAKSAKEKRYKGATARQLTTITAKANTAQAAIDAVAPVVDGERLIELAKLGSTIVDGGFVKTGLVSASNIIAGKMQSEDGKTYFDLDNSKILETAVIGGRTITVEISAAKPFELSIDGYPQIYVKNGILVTSPCDVNEDGYVDETDLELVLYYVLHPTERSAGLTLYPKMDVNHDGDVSSSDLTLISRAAGIYNTIGAGSYKAGVDSGGFYTLFNGSKVYRYTP